MNVVHKTGDTSFRGAERWTALFAGAGCMLLASGTWQLPATEPEAESARLIALVLCVFGLWTVFTAIRHWRRPYIRFQNDTLVVFEQNRPQYIDCRLIEEFSSQPHRTLLRMKYGGEVSISHLPFATSQEVERFKTRLNQFVL
jgi:hypothetical protein